MYFSGLIGTIEARPMVEEDYAYTISASCKILNDYMELKFIGRFAQSECKRILSLRTGDVVILSGRIVDKELHVQDIKLMAKEVVGRNLNKYM